jgi:type IV secretory pathway TraG/TraD family ATPase VirD4
VTLSSRMRRRCRQIFGIRQIDGRKDALARLRKFGGRCVLGFQSIAQVRGTNGDANAQTIVENCGTTGILRCSASERGGPARFASELIGQRDVIRAVTPKSKVNTQWFPDEATSEHHTTEFAVLPSEIEHGALSTSTGADLSGEACPW